jgi:hypothetical protein
LHGLSATLRSSTPTPHSTVRTLSITSIR